MRMLFIVAHGYQPAGATTWCDEFFTRLAGRGHELEMVVAGQADAGDREAQVVVHRLAVAEARKEELHPLLRRCIDHGLVPRPDLQAEWLRHEGPAVPDLVDWLRHYGRTFDAVAVVGYASQMAWDSLTALAGWVPTVLHPLAADEARLGLGLFATLLRQPSALAYVDQRELDLLRPRAGRLRTAAIVGCGVDMAEVSELARGSASQYEGLRAAIDGRPYLVLVDSTSDCPRIVEYFHAYKKRHPGPLQLIVWGGPAEGDESNGGADDVVWSSWDGRAARVVALASAVATIEPLGTPPVPVVWGERSALRRPGLVATSDGRELRPEPGAIGFADFTGFEAAVDLLTSDQKAAATLGDEGGRFVESRCQWGDLLDRYERLLHVIQTRR